MTNAATTAHREQPTGDVRGGLRVILRLEGLLLLGVSVLVYRHLGGSLALFALLCLVPDLGMLGYFAGPRWGAAAYNASHSVMSPALLVFAGWSGHWPPLFAVAAIWTAHIGFDRAVGYGLKYSTAFGATHLGWKGKPA